MICVTNLQDEDITINPDQIIQIRSGGGPEVIIEFSNGHSMRVKNSIEELTESILKWQQRRWMPIV